MTTTPRTGPAIEARRLAAVEAVKRVEQVLQRIRREGTAVSVAEVARRAAVSRTFLYQNDQASDAIAKAKQTRIAQADRHQSEIEAGWRERALNAEQQLHQVNGEILSQRARMGELLGQIRDLEADLPVDGVQRVITENHTLKEKLRQSATELQRFEDRLAGARDNNRFLDRRIATLEAELVSPTTPPAHEATVTTTGHNRR